MCTGLRTANPAQPCKGLDASTTASAARNGLQGLSGSLPAGASAVPATVCAPNQWAGQAAHRVGGDFRVDHFEDARSEASLSDAEGSASSTEGRMSRQAGNHTTARNQRGPCGNHRPPSRPMPAPPKEMRRKQSFMSWKDEEDQRLTALVVNHPIGPIEWSTVADILAEEGRVRRSSKQCRER